MTASTTSYLVCYDVSHSVRRLAKVRRKLAAVASPLQYSVFYGTFTSAERDRLLARLAHCIEPARDDVRLYPVPTSPWFVQLGRANLPPGIFGPGPGWLSRGIDQPR